MKKIIIILVLIFFNLSFSAEQSEKIICYIPKELKTSSKARLIYEDTEKYKDEEIPPEVANPEIVKALKERRLVVFQMRCKYDGDMYRYITASDYAVEYLTKQTINKEKGDYYLLELPTNKALAFQDMLFIGDFIDNSISTNDELFQILYMINVQFLEIRQQELEEEGLKVVY
ncbi:DNA methyltransferase [Leptotrichia shahii]|uniref:DNA methyltransferase n=1 Tax=Leptotrichia shahii TaxID=157691 RepID=UPI0028D5C22A|nr:DNA methyltransferase [Leptotrichia shahii]